MRKIKNKSGADKKVVKSSNNSGKAADTGLQKLHSIDEDDQGFGGWLRSAEGLDNIKLFVIANNIVLLTTLALPHIQSVLDIIVETMYGGVLLWYSFNVWNMIMNYFNEEFKKAVLNKDGVHIIDEIEEYEEI